MPRAKKPINGTIEPKAKQGRPPKAKVSGDGIPFNDPDGPSAADVLEHILDSGNSGLDVKDIANAFDRSVGGADGFIEMLMKIYKASPLGSMANMRVVQMFWQLIKHNTTPESMGDFSLLSDDDLKKVFNKRAGKVKMKEPPVNDLPDSADHYTI